MNTTTISNGETTKHFVLVRVTVEPGADLHPEDLDDENQDAISGCYGYEIDPETAADREVEDDEDPVIEAALDQFHDEIAIKVLDNYEIVATRIEKREDADNDTTWA